MVDDITRMFKDISKVLLIIGLVNPILIIIPTIILALIGFDPVIYLMVLGSSISSTLVFHSIKIRKIIDRYSGS